MSSMLSFMRLYAYTLFILILLGGMGGFVSMLFSDRIKYPVFVAPLSGLLAFAFGMAFLCGICVMPFDLASDILIVLYLSATAITLLFAKPDIRKFPLKLFIISLLFIAVILLITNFAAIYFGYVGSLIMNGTDQFGYSQVADWLRMHSTHWPVLSPNRPYESWIHYTFTSDPRFGIMYVYAFLSWLFGHPGIFSCNFNCAVILLAGFFAVSSVFSKSKLTWVLLLVGLLLSVWYDLGMSGYFGKIFAYPSIIFIVGLFIIKRTFSAAQAVILALLVSAVTLSYNAIPIVLILTFTTGLFVVFNSLQWLFHRNKDDMCIARDLVLVFILLVCISCAVGGYLMFPKTLVLIKALGPTYVSFKWFCLKFLPALFGFGSSEWVLLLISVLISGYFLILALQRRSLAVVAIITAPWLLLLSIPVVWGVKLAVCPLYELCGVFYPLILCGMICLFGDYSLISKKSYKIMLSLIAVFMIVHLPHFHTKLHCYTYKFFKKTNLLKHDFIYLQKQFDGIAGIVGSNKVIVSTGNILYVLPILVEFGRRGMSLQWSAKDWQLAVGYRLWPPPKLDLSSRFWLQHLGDKLPKKSCKIVYKSIQYQLVDCK